MTKPEGQNWPRVKISRLNRSINWESAQGKQVG